MDRAIFYRQWKLPCGPMIVASLDNKLVMTDWLNGWHHQTILNRFEKLLNLPFKEATTAVIDCAIDQLQEYCEGKRKQFDLPIELIGTPFQIKVWRALQTIAYGQCVSYADIARAIGQPRALRAVGGAVGQNPLSIIVPCHRVIGSNKTLTGYGGGFEAKRFLLNIEGQRV